MGGLIPDFLRFQWPISLKHWVFASLLLSLPGQGAATTPLFDKVEINGELGNLHQAGKGWLDLPPSEKLQELRLAEMCSAIGGPRGKYRLVDGKLWLISLYRCGGDVPLNAIYASGEPILAKWISADLVAELGKPLCRRGFAYVYERTVSLLVEEGTVTSIREESNANHPWCQAIKP